jgi:voltage-gated potassium channel
MHELAHEIPVLLGMVAATVLIHMLGLMGLTQLTKIHITHLRTPWLAIDRLLVPLGMVVGLFLLHGLEVFAYAGAFQAVGETKRWEAAVYLSAGSYATAGWAGINVSHDWRVLAAFESLNGMLLLGWSTAYLFQTLHRILQTEQNHPLQEGAISEEPAVSQPTEAEAGAAKPSPRRKRSGRGAP